MFDHLFPGTRVSKRNFVKLLLDQIRQIDPAVKACFDVEEDSILLMRTDDLSGPENLPLSDPYSTYLRAPVHERPHMLALTARTCVKTCKPASDLLVKQNQDATDRIDDPGAAWCERS
jgi:hypothetical protein